MQTHPTLPPHIQANFDELTRKSGLEDIAVELGCAPMSHTDAMLAKLLTCSPQMEEIKTRVRKFAPSDIPVLILGETGTGKELLANALHGNRKPQTFVAINCGAIPSELLESELFGAKKGAFTGSENRAGLIERAREGTLFLDEIGDMPHFMQCKLLRVLEEKCYRKVGETTETTINFRLVCATNHLELEKHPEKFRRDLYYRIAGTIIKVPRLKERGALDVAIIANSIAKSPGIAEMAITKAMESEMLGNIRELRNIIQELNVLYASA